MTAHHDGYSIQEGVLAACEIETLLRAIERQALPHSRAGARHVLGSPPIRELAHDVRLTSIASTWLGAPALPFKATLFSKTQEANWLVAWHQDTALPLAARVPRAGWGPWSEKYGVTYAHAPASALSRVVALRIHLDDSDSDNGPLRVLPGTHALGVLTDAEIHERATCIAPRDCCTPAGGIVAMAPLIIHASSKCIATRLRRVLHLEYATSLEIAPGMHLKAA